LKDHHQPAVLPATCTLTLTDLLDAVRARVETNFHYPHHSCRCTWKKKLGRVFMFCHTEVTKITGTINRNETQSFLFIIIKGSKVLFIIIKGS
jgi:hypothetical protein